MLVRMAAWPWSALEPLRSPALAEFVDGGAGPETVAAAHEEAVARERRHLLATVAADPFRRAVALGHPGVAVQLEAYLARPGVADRPPTKARYRRLEATLTNLLLRAAGRPTPNGLWAGVVPVGPGAGPRAEAWSVQVDLDVLGEAFEVDAGRPLPVGRPDPWRVLDDAIDLLPAAAAPRWREARDALRAVGDGIEEAGATATPAALRAAHAAAAASCDALRRAAGLPAVGTRPVLRVDRRLPRKPALDAALADAGPALSAAVGAWIDVMEAIGLGPMWAAATARSVLHPGEGATAAGGPASAVPDAASLFAPFGPEAVALAAQRCRWLGSLLGSASTVAPAAPGQGMGPWGCALAVPGPGGWIPRSVRGDPAFFLARWAGLAPGPYAAALDAAVGTGWRPRPVRVTRYVNLGASLCPPFGQPLDPAPGALVDVAGRVGLAADGRAVPVIETAAAPVFADPTEAAAYRAASTWGWELVATGLPPLPEEVAVLRHLPPILAPSGVVVHPRRWLLAPDELAACAGAATAVERFVAWRALVGRRGLPEVLTVRLRASPSAPHLTVLADSALSVEAFLGEIDDRVAVAVVFDGPDVDGLLPGPDGEGHVAEVAVAFTDRRWAGGVVP